MDYHFLKPKTSENLRVSPNIQKLLTRFLPVFILAAILPVMIGFVIAPPDIEFLTRADTNAELRVWLEPANVVMSNGASVELSVVANFEGDNKLIPEIAMEFASNGGVMVVNPQLTHSIPFNGKAELGKVLVRATDVGSGVVKIPVESVLITALEGEVKINTGDANIMVR